MLQDIIAVNLLQNYKLHLRFEDNQEGVVDIQQQIKFIGVFEPLKDPNYFGSVQICARKGV
ncbi:MAG: DUF2442 domain-containing protein [Synechocystis sp.]